MAALLVAIGRFGFRLESLSRAAWVALPLGLSAAFVPPAAAQSLQEVEDAFEMMVGSAAICADYLARPEVLEDNRRLGREKLMEAGMSEADAEAFLGAAAAAGRADTSNEMQKQVACEIVNIPALK